MSGQMDDNLYALNPADGSLKWQYTTGNHYRSSPALGADGTIYVGSMTITSMRSTRRTAR